MTWSDNEPDLGTDMGIDIGPDLGTDMGIHMGTSSQDKHGNYKITHLS